MDPKPNGTEWSFTPALPRRSRDSSPPVSALQYVRGDTENRLPPFPTPVGLPFQFQNPPLPARIYRHAGEGTERRPRLFAMATRSPYKPSFSHPPTRTHQQAREDTGGGFSPLSEPPLHSAWRDTKLANGNQTRTGGTAATPATQPSPTHTSESCSLTLCINSSTQRYPPTRFGVLEIKREQAGRKTTGHDVFMVFREIYYWRLRPPSQRLLSFSTLRHIEFVEFTNAEHPTPLVMDAKLRRDIIHVFNKPHLISTDDTWVDWICDLGEDPDHDYGVLFVHDWDRQKIAVLVGVPWIISVVTAIVWIAGTGDIANAMAVSSYIMSATGVVVGLLAVLSAVET